jgi:hypothetical protein
MSQWSKSKKKGWKNRLLMYSSMLKMLRITWRLILRMDFIGLLLQAKLSIRKRYTVLKKMECRLKCMNMMCFAVLLSLSKPEEILLWRTTCRALD